MITLDKLLKALILRAEREGDASAQLAGGLVVRVARLSRGGYRITGERWGVKPRDSEMETLQRLVGRPVVRSGGPEEAGLLVRRWFEIQ